MADPTGEGQRAHRGHRVASLLPHRLHHRLHQRLRRLPLRTRLVAGFAAVMAVVLAAGGAFIFWRVDYALDRRVNSDLRVASAQLLPLVQTDGSIPGDDPDDGAALSQHQVLDASGQVLAAGAAIGSAPLLPSSVVQAALAGPVYFDVGSPLPLHDRPLRLYAVPVGGPPGSPSPSGSAGSAGSAAVLVVATSRAASDEALRELLAQLALVGLATLVLTTVVGDRLASAALRPVERYRTQAHAVAAGEPDVRLDVPADRDDEVTRLGHTLNDMLTALDAAMARERRFVQDASHELRTPLTLLRTRVELARRRPRTREELGEVLAELDVDLRELQALAQQLLDLSTAAPPPSTPTDLAVVVDEVARLSGGGADSLPPTWKTTIHDDARPAPVLVGERALRQGLFNLLGNAARHGGPHVQVCLYLAGPGVVALSVSDDGAGMAADFLPTALLRFARAGEARERPGSGLGLSVVDQLVSAVGGELRLCSRGAHHRAIERFAVPCTHPDEGTWVTVVLPLASS
ncbi:HAMP domain-containing histidine kinase [Streptomyces sp. NP160]|uniref:sensor histidine kinase n=1 Tax=Streptomyces sp. NP160 TaxID=2586637 RepID=UPI00111862D5|nr:HAMP domain-containing sensor histidine kinase [Streptomyces sp. NP160]TNM61924.1 HAMP domain-containing histidine kinase [Streptomyces sp. NP160]